MSKNRSFGVLYLTLIFAVLGINLKAQNVIHQSFEKDIFRTKPDTSDLSTYWRKYSRTGEVNAKSCALPQIKANASTGISTEQFRKGKQAGKVVLDVSNGGVGHKAMFRYTILPAGKVLEESKDEIWVSFSLYLPNEGDDKWETDTIPELIFQLHNDIVASPMLAIYSQNDRFNITYRFADADPHQPIPHQNPRVSIRKPWSGKIQKGKWLDWVFRIKFSPLTENGLLQVWLNKDNNFEKIVDKQQIRIGYNCSERTDLDIGIYKWDWKCPTVSKVKKRVMYVDEVSIGNSAANLEAMVKAFAN